MGRSRANRPLFETVNVSDPDRVLIFDVDAARASAKAEALKPWGLFATHCPDPARATAAIDEASPSVVLVVEAGDAEMFSEVRAAAGSRHIPVLALVELGNDPRALARRVRPYDGWSSVATTAEELATRLLGLALAKVRGTAIDPRFLALTVHDLRTPLNVIGLTIRTIGQSVPVKSPEFEEDLLFLHENAKQIERMLAQVGDFCRLLESESPPTGVAFDFARLLADFVEERAGRAGAASGPPVSIDLGGPGPREVSLDPNRTKMALQHALANAVEAAGKAPVRIEVGGDPGRLRIGFVVDKPPPSTVKSITLKPDLYERLSGSAAERRGLDLAIAARISELFGGTARLEVDPGQRSTIVLDWPARIMPDG